MYVIRKAKQELSSLPAKELAFQDIRALGSGLAQKMLGLIAEAPEYPKKIAEKLGVHEQKVYYHIRNLERAGVIEVAKTKIVKGAAANVYRIVEPAFVIAFKDFRTTQKIMELEEQPKSFLEPFIEDGQLNALIVVGSPDPHGPEKARSRDGYYAGDLALFLGTFLNYVPGLHVRLDTEVGSEELEKNLILVGGPVINTVTGKINAQLPIRFDAESHNTVVSTLSGKMYSADEVGVIVKAVNPFNKKKRVMLIAGKRHAGTRAVIIALIKHFNEIIKGNKYNSKVLARIVEGVDMDSDGIVDEVEILE